VERCLACEADAVGTMEGSRFYPDPVCTHTLESPRLLLGRVRAGGSHERLLTSLQPTAIPFVSYQCNTISQTASWDVSGSRLLDNASEIRRLFARSDQVTGNLQKRLPFRGADRGRPRKRGSAPQFRHQSPITNHQSPITSHAPVASTALRSAFKSPGVSSTSPAFALAIACSPLRAPTKACVQPG
jgi:hypothetical protein